MTFRFSWCLLLGITFDDYWDRRVESASGLVCISVRTTGSSRNAEEIIIRSSLIDKVTNSVRLHGSRTVRLDPAADGMLEGGTCLWSCRLQAQPRLIRVADTGVSVFCDRNGFNDTVISGSEPAVTMRATKGDILRTWNLSDLVRGRQLIHTNSDVRRLSCEWLIDCQPSTDGDIVWIIVDVAPVVTRPQGGIRDIEVLKLQVANGSCDRATEKDVAALLSQADPAIRHLGCTAALVLGLTDNRQGRLGQWITDELVDGQFDTCVREVLSADAGLDRSSQLSNSVRSWLLMENAQSSVYKGVDYGIDIIYPRAICLRALMGAVPSPADMQFLSEWLEATGYDKAAYAIIGTWGTDASQKSVESIMDSVAADRVVHAIRTVQGQTPTSNPLWE